MKEDVKALCDCDEIFMLSNWTDSKGAIIEHTIAMYLGLKVSYEPKNTDNENIPSLFLRKRNLQMESTNRNIDGGNANFTNGKEYINIRFWQFDC